MKKSVKRGIAIVAASAMALSVMSVCNLGRSRAAELLRGERTEYVRDTNITVDRDGELVITRNELGSKQMGKEDSWTIFVYMCGSDLESYYGLASMDIKEMIAASESENVNVIVQTGGARTWRGNGVSSTQLGRYEVKGDKLQLVETLPAANMGDASTMEGFLKWGVENYAAEHMGVVYWNHGGGSITGVCFDERNSYDSLYLAEVEKALDGATESMTDKFDFIGFDACLMATAETANVLAPYANYMIGSEETEPGYGWDYTPLVNTLVQNPDVDTEKLGKIIVDTYYDSLVQINQQGASTLSVVDLNKVDDLFKEFNVFSKNMSDTVKEVTDITAITKIASGSENYGGNNAYEGYTNMVDLGDFVKNMAPYVDGAEEVLKALDEAVVYNKCGTSLPDSNGLAFYYPLSVSGMGEYNILRNIVTSPYYMNYLDKVLYASKYKTLDGFVSNEWENSEYYFDKDYEYIKYMFTSFSDYKAKYMNTSYFKNAEFDDNWYSWFTKKTNEVNETPVYSDDLAEWIDGLRNNEVDKNATDSLDNYVSAEYQVVVPNGDTVNVLGTVGNVDSDVKMDGKWFALADGQYLAAEYITEGNGLTLYAAPAVVDGKEVTIRFVADADKDVFVLGAWDGIDENGQAGKGLREIKAGSKVTPLYTSINTVTGEINRVAGNEMVVVDNVITSATVESNTVVARLTDAFGGVTYSAPMAK